MTLISKSWGLWGIELSLFRFDPINMEVGSWELIAAKALVKLFDLNIVLASLEISDTRATIGALNCFLTVFWG